MTRFCASPGFRQVLALVPVGVACAILLTPAVAARAQAPVTLAPPRSLAPARPAPAVTPDPAAPASSGPGIVVDTLGEIDANSVGVLDTANGGFGVAMWRGTPRALVEKLLPALPAAPRTVVGRQLLHRLLLSAAETPQGPAGKDVPSLVAMRVERLLAQGDLPAARSLLRIIPQRVEEEALLRARAEVALLLNDNAGACAIVLARLGRSSAIFWRKAQVFCQLLAGDGAGAQIGAGLLLEQGVEDPGFYGLARLLGNEKGIAVAGMEKPSPLHVAMMRAARVQVPALVVAEGDAAVLRAVAVSPNADLETRLEAAERAEARGALDVDTLRQLYLSVNFTPDELSGALSAAEKLSGPLGRALLYRAARNQKVASAQAEIVARAFRLARAQGRLGTAVRVFRAVLAGIEASEDLAWFAADAGAALYAFGDSATAAKWLALAPTKRDSAADGDAARRPPAAAVLWPFAALSALPRPAPEGEAAAVSTDQPTGEGVTESAAKDEEAVAVQVLAAPDAAADGFDEKAYMDWWQAMDVIGGEARARRATLILSALEALGARVGDAPWVPLISTGAEAVTLPAAGTLAALKRAAAAGRVGETLLLALTALGDTAPGKLDTRVLVPVMRALRAIGLGEAARALALEAVFDHAG